MIRINYLTLVACFLALSVSSVAQWTNVGAPFFSPANAQYVSHELDESGTPWVAFQDAGNGFGLTVMRYNGSSWDTVGTPAFSPGAASWVVLKFNSLDEPYVAFADAANSNKLSVMRFDGTTWQVVGSYGFTFSDAEYIDLDFNDQDWPYVSYRAPGQFNSIRVEYFQNPNWWTMPSPQTFPTAVMYTDIEFGSSGDLYLAFQDINAGNALTVEKYDFGSMNWSYLGSAGVSPGSAEWISMKLDAQERAYVAFADGANGNAASLLFYDGASWSNIGSPGFTPGVATYVDLVLDNNDVPHIAFRDGGNANQISVMGYGTGTWALIGSAGFSGDFMGFANISFYPGKLYVAFEHQNIIFGARVMEYDLGCASPYPPNVATLSDTVCIGASTTLLVAESDNLHDAVNWTLYSGSCGGTIEGSNSTGNFSVSPTAATTYYIRGEGGCVTPGNCDSIHIEVIAPSSPPSVTPVGPVDLCDGTGLTLNATGDSGATYCWKELNSVTIDWQMVGNQGFSNASSSDIDIKFNQSIPYVTYTAIGQSYLMRYDGLTWNAVGSAPFSSGTDDYNSLAFDSGDRPHVAFRYNFNQATVMRYDGTVWSSLGPTSFTPAGAEYLDLEFDVDTAYVCFRDLNAGSGTSVMKYDGTNWNYVGASHFSVGDAISQDMEINNGELYVAYRDVANGNATTVMTYNGSSWIPVGTPGFTPGSTDYPDLEFYDDTAYVAFQDATESDRVTLMKYDGTNWVTVGNPGFTADQSYDIRLKFDQGGTPFVSYQDAFNGHHNSVMKFDGNGWIQAGSAGFTPDMAWSNSLAIDNDGQPWVAFSDDGASGRVSVMKLDTTCFDFGDSINVTMAGVYQATMTDSNGCEVTAINDVTVNILATSTGYEAPSTCYQYVSPSGNFTWTSSGTYTDVLPNAVGCDSIITVDLTIEHTTNSITDSACYFYLSPSGNFTWTTSGTYVDTLFGANSAGCDSIITVNLTSVDTVDTAVTVMSPMLTALSTGAMYQWIDCSTMAPIAGETNQSFSPASNGTYAVIVMENGCTDTSACHSITDVGLAEYGGFGVVTLYPNPTSEVFSIKLDKLLGQVDMRVFTLDGRLLLDSRLTESISTIDASEWASGMYTIVLSNTDGQRVLKMQKH